MDKEKGKKIIKLVADAYPNLEFTTSRAALWLNMLEGAEYEAIERQAMKYIAGNRFPPTIADILGQGDKKRRTQEADTMSPAQILNRGKYDTFVH